MSKAAAMSIFTCPRDLDVFLGMYLTERQTHGAGASQPSASALQPSAKTSQPQRQTNPRDCPSPPLASVVAPTPSPHPSCSISPPPKPTRASGDSEGTPPARDAHGAGASQPSASNRWASAWVTRAIAAELSRLQPFEFLSLRQKADTREVSHTGTWAHFLNKLERCVAAQTRQELGVANIEHSRRFSACDALQTATTAVVSLIYKLQVRSPDLIDEFFSLAEQLVENTRRFVAADVV